VRRSLIFLLPAILSVGCKAPERPTPQPRSQQLVRATSQAAITDVHFWSESLQAILRYQIIVPSHLPEENLPILYFLPGANSGPDDVMDSSQIVDQASASHLIVVIPQADNSYYTNAQHLRHAQWEDAITIDLPRDVAVHFPIQHERRYTGIAGISMGGYGAIKLTLKHPDLYSFTGVMSGALDITRRPPSLLRWSQTIRTWSIFGYREDTRRTEDVFDLLSRQPPRPDVQWFASCGRSDPLAPTNLRFVNQLNAHGVQIDLLEPLGGHDWQSWNIALPALFKAAASALH
jgi:putative tributyrin esterase